jgi:hypothetical protein
MHFLVDLFTPKVAYADLDSFISHVDTMIVNPLIDLLFALAIVIFLWGVFEFFLNEGNDEKRTTGKSHMVWGVIGLVIMLGVWGILGLMLDTLGVSGVKIDKDSNNGGQVKVDELGSFK